MPPKRDLFSGCGLIVAPHMDDETIACGALLAQHPEQHQWHILFATDGALSPYSASPRNADPSVNLPAVRRCEAIHALRVLGIPQSNAHFLDFPDGQLALCQSQLNAAVHAWIRRLRPDHLLIPFRYDRHPDHLAVHRAGKAFISDNGDTPQVTEYITYGYWRLLPGGDVRLLLAPDRCTEVAVADVASRKRQALDCFVSQTTCYFPWQDRPVLTDAFCDAVCRTSESFIGPGAGPLLTSAFAHQWLRLIHVVEPPLKRLKHHISSKLHKTRP